MKKLSLILVVILFFNCSKSGDDGSGNTPPPPVVIDPPTSATLIFPDNNEECTQGVEFSPTQSTVTFTWTAGSNTDSYDLVLKNLNTNVISNHAAGTSQLAITILKATPYSWYVKSKSNETSETAQSATWKFYNAGDGEDTYPPFPAGLIAPAMGANLTGVSNVTLEWSGSDVDGDIVGYDVLFDTSTSPTTALGGTGTETTREAAVTGGNIYYWRVITTDAEGNNSESEIFEFRVD